MSKSDNNIFKIDLDNKDEYINKYNDNKLSEDLHDYIFDSAMKIKRRKYIQLKRADIIFE